MAELSLDFKNEIINEIINEKRRYVMTENEDGTVSFTDVTSYSQTGTKYGAEEVIEEREAINQNTNVIGGDAYDSSKSYTADDYFIYNNQLCKALTAISGGTSLSEGTNYETTSLENEIAGLNGNLENIFTANGKNNVDYNTLTAGIHYCGTGCLNAPEGHCRVICLYSYKNPSTDSIQLAFSVSTPTMYRRRMGSGGTWGDWRKITFDAII